MDEGSGVRGQGSGELPERISLDLKRVQSLRYGENPHQLGALYADDLPVAGATLVGSLKQLHGPELSYNNLMDADAALALVRDYTMPAVAIIKHAGPCGIACGADDGDLADVFSRALASDPVSAFGGIVGINRAVDSRLAEHLAKVRFDVLVAPAFDEEAIDTLARKKSLRLLAVPDDITSERDDDFASKLSFRQVSGGFLVQTRDAVDYGHPAGAGDAAPPHTGGNSGHGLRMAGGAARALQRHRTGAQAGDCRHRRWADSRVDSVKIAVEKAGEHARGAVMASDAFFPFPGRDRSGAAAGVTAVIQPGGR